MKKPEKPIKSESYMGMPIYNYKGKDYIIEAAFSKYINDLEEYCKYLENQIKFK